MNKISSRFISICSLFFILSLRTQAQLNIPSDGSDGVFNPTANVEIDLGQAPEGEWNMPGNGNGMYDPKKWAVVFKYSSVNIPVGVKVTFKNRPSRAPVVWLVRGNVTINGELNLDGKSGTADNIGKLIPTEPGPGGFRGGASGPSGSGAGLGPGGPNATWIGTAGYAGIYGNPQIVPLIGGSGIGAQTDQGASGHSGGGAIAIFAAGAIDLNGVASAKGAASVGFGGSTTSSSGGAIRLVASSVSGNGQVICVNDKLNNPGRIRIETVSLSPSLRTAPETIGVAPANPPIIWPAANAPTARVVSVDSVQAPVEPTAPLVASADLAIQNDKPVAILIETSNFPIEGVVQLNITPKFGDKISLRADRVSGDIVSALWKVETVLPRGFVILQARATQP